MRILGADGLKDSPVALNAIASGYVVDGDVCLAKEDTFIYFYRLVDGHGGAENLPSVVVPADEPSTNTSKRWVLTGTYSNDVSADEIIANLITTDQLIVNTISSLPSGSTLINDVVEITQDTVNFLNVTDPPFEVNSSDMVSGLNAEFINGLSVDEIVGNVGYTETIFVPSGIRALDVVYTTQRLSSNYSIFSTLINSTDTDPSIYTSLITHYDNEGFTIKFSDIIDSQFYMLSYTLFYNSFDFATYLLADDGVGNYTISDSTGSNFVVFTL